ncbi:MAG: NADP-dependent isocitrate dehydrogenase [Alphaproteobacteria bacterium]|nr:NADP-dependent isocitrate dehydrogenase [Alphaproteobacteria bacterium]MDD9919488.1 NADP-dependent isocitrate dehydrogenase [Alphaproteobacteria bacterium]
MTTKTQKKVPVTVARGDGIGPEIMDATMRILEAAGARIEPEYVTLGEEAFKQGIMNGVTDEAWESIRRTGILFKSPLTTPQGGGYKSVNVTMRKTFGMFANVRPVRTFEPYVYSKHKGVDMVIVRENEEDLYAGIEYRQTLNTCHSVKFMSRTGSEMIIRYAFEYARVNGRKKITCLVKDNIMKISDGLFHKTFDLVGKEYPEIEQEALIVDIGMARVADTPENFDVVVTLNLYGDIVSDIASQISGSVGVAGSMNIGRGCAMFEAVHGSAPDIAGQGIANPSGLLNGAILMLEHLGQGDVASNIGNAWLAAIEGGCHTGDIAEDKKKALSTSEFADKVIAHLGKKPKGLQAFKVTDDQPLKMPAPEKTTKTQRDKKIIGVDVFIDWDGTDPQELGGRVEKTQTGHLGLLAISSRGLKMYPGKAETKAVTDHWRCRFKSKSGKEISQRDIRDLLASFDLLNLKWTKLESLCTFDGEAGYSMMQGE